MILFISAELSIANMASSSILLSFPLHFRKWAATSLLGISFSTRSSVENYNLPTQESHMIFGRCRKKRCSVGELQADPHAGTGFLAASLWEFGKQSFCYYSMSERDSGSLEVFWKLKQFSCGTLRTTLFFPPERERVCVCTCMRKGGGEKEGPRES